jgi:flagellar hook-length control protein FliK
MEALSIQAVKSNYQPDGTQTQSSLGDIFQALLRDSVERQNAPALPSRFSDRPELEASRPDRVDTRGRTDGADRLERAENTDTDYRDDDGPAIRVDEPIKERDTATNPEAQPKPIDSTRSEQPSVNRDTPEPDGARVNDQQTADASETSAAPLNQVQSAAAGLGVAASADGKGGQVKPTALPLAGTSGNAAAVSQAVTAANQAQIPVSSVPPSLGNSTTAATSANGNGFAAQVTVTPAQVVATPNAGLGGGAATLAIAATNTSGQAVTTTANTGPATGLVQNASTVSAAIVENQVSSGAPSNAQIVPTDGKALTAQSSNNAAVVASTVKQEAGTAGSETRNGNTLNTPLTAEAPIQNALAKSVPSGTAQNGQPQITGEASGQTFEGQIENTKPANTQNQQTQSAQQVPTGQTANAAAQARGATALAQGEQNSNGSAASTEAASSRAGNAPSFATGGFAQAMAQTSDTLGSLTRSGGSLPSAANQVAVEIQKAVVAGKDQIRIRLNPAELGQIDVSLKVRNDGTVKAVVTVDRPETFDLMQRDARGMERALQEAGLKTDSGSLSFNLRDGDQQAPNDGQRGQGPTTQSNPDTKCMAESQTPQSDAPVPYVSDRALDMRV